MRSLAIFGLTVALALPAAGQQSPPFGERVDVNVVLIDTVITDDHGNQILGLSKDDFVVKENGVRQTIDSVDYFTSRRLLTNPEEQLPFKIEQIKEERLLVFFFDKPEGGQLFDQIARARRSVENFINTDMGGNDQVAIVGHDVRLKIYSDFTSNKQQLKKALNEAATFSNGTTKSPANGGPSILRNIGTRQLINRTGTVYEALELLGDSVRPIRGRKNLVLFSPGVREPSEEVRDGMLLSESRYYRPMVESLNTANVTVYATNLVPNQSAPAFHQTLERLTDATNGEYFRNSVSFEPMIQHVEKASGGYYLITYRTQKPRGARGFQKVDVSIKNPEFRVKARAGYVYGQ